MPTSEQLGMLRIEDFNDPVSYRYEMNTPSGLINLDLSVDIKIVITDPSYIPAIGEALWKASIATAISSSVRLEMLRYVRWKSSPLALPSSPLFPPHGTLFNLPINLAHCAQVMLHTGHSDNYAARRWALPYTPFAWQADGLLTSRGWDSLLTWAQGLAMGLAGDTLGGDLQQLIMYSGAVTPSVSNLNGVAFRRVTHLKVLQHTDKAPEWDGGLWP